jgi:competence protein ComGC
MRKITSSRHGQRTGFGLLELVVCVGCLLLLLLIFLPWLLTARSSSREKLCQMRAKAVADGVVLYAESHANDLPYLVDETGWPVVLAPYLNLPGTMRDEKLLPQEDLKTLSVPQLVCPDDPRAREQTGVLSFVMNGGYGLFPVDGETGSVSETGTHTAGIDLDGDGEVSNEEWAINYATGVCWRPDTRPAPDDFRMSLPWISAGDGMEFTLLLAENTNAGHWLSKDTMDLAFVIGRDQLKFAEAPESQGPLDLKSVNLGPFAINANLGTLPGHSPAPSSLHGDYVHVMYCDGHGGPLSAKIDPLAYAGLMTSNGSKYGQAGKSVP